MQRFKEKVTEKKEFIITCEFVPGRGISGQSVEDVLKFGEKVITSGLPIHAISITDNPGGNPAISPDILADELRTLGLEALVHISCSGMNRNTLEARATSLARKKLENLLVVSGDYPIGGYQGKAKPVFDLDSVQAIHYLKEMNDGIEIPGRGKNGPTRLPKTDFFVACGCSPFGKSEAELVPQIIKLEKKILAGADLLISNVGYDVRKFAEILKCLKHRNMDLPLFGNCYVLSRPVARLMNKGEVPGCVVTDELLKLIEQEFESPDKGKQARLERASRLIAIFRGMKFSGVHIGGFGLKFEDYEFIIRHSEELTRNWREYIPDFRFGRQGEFYLFPEDPDLTFAQDKLIPVKLTKKRPFLIHFTASKIFHRLLFTANTPGFAFCKMVYRLLEKHQFASAVVLFLEQHTKRALFDCQKCGDCALFTTAYLCPMSACAKFQRNGPCAGSRNGLCESNNGKECFWVKVYRRLSSTGNLDSIREYIPPVDYSLAKTSSWGNFFLGRDHTGKRALPCAMGSEKETVVHQGDSHSATPCEVRQSQKQLHKQEVL